MHSRTEALLPAAVDEWQQHFAAVLQVHVGLHNCKLTMMLSWPCQLGKLVLAAPSESQMNCSLRWCSACGESMRGPCLPCLGCLGMYYDILCH